MMKIKRIRDFFAVLILFAAILACSKFEKITKQEYRKDDLAFAHLSNWKITEDKTTVTSGIETRYLSIEGSDNAILILNKFPNQSSTTLEDYVQEVQKLSNSEIKEMTGGYDVVKIGEAQTSPTAAQIGGVPRAGLLRDFDIKALGIPVPHRAEHYLIEIGDAKWFITAQAPKEDWNSVNEGFQTIYNSLSFGQAASAKGN